jgi:protease-4
VTRRTKRFLFALAGLGTLVGIIALAVLLSHGVERGTVIELTIGGMIVEERDTSLQGRFLQGDVTLVSELRELLDKARRDESVQGIIALIKPAEIGPADIEEILDSVAAFRESGKWTMGFIEGAGELSSGSWTYMLASAFDDLTMAPLGDVNLAGVLATVPFFRGTLDKIGVHPDFDHIGEYKSAKDIYTEKGFTEAHREATSALLSDLFDVMADRIAESRGIPPEEVRSLIDRGPFTGEEALEEGLVDRLAYYDEFLDAAEERAGGELRSLDWEEYLERRGGFGEGRHKIAVIHASGVIHRGRSGYDPSVGLHAGSDSVAGALRDAREDPSVKAIILRVDSPGGSALASDIIWREASLAREKKPVIASLSDVAASGGYYIACGADRIIAEPSTITASIGVVYGKFVKKGLYDWIGLNYGQIKFGEHADFWTDLKQWSPEEKEQYYWKFVRRYYDRFVQRVADARQMTREAVDGIGQGRVWSGTRALELGLVDDLGGFDSAVRAARELAQIPESEGVRFIVLPEKPSWWESLWEGKGASMELPPAARATLRELGPLGQAILLDGEPAMLMPAPVLLNSH